MDIADYPLDEIRSQFPALQRMHNGKPVTYFDGPSGTQVCHSAITGIIGYLNEGSANLGGQYPTSKETEDIVEAAREAMADLLGCNPKEIAFGMNMTSLTFDISRALSRNWTAGDDVVVTEMDHRANVDTWIEAARDRGAGVNWIRLDPETLTLDLSNLDSVITEKTKVVAIGHASNGIGTINDIEHVVARAREVGALVVMDAVHSAPHLFIDRDDLDVDIILCSAYKFFGPHLGIAAIRESVFEKLPVYRITTAPKIHPGKLETGTQSFEALSGVVGAIDFLASIGTGSSRREQLRDAYDKIHSYENLLASTIRQKLASFHQVTIYQAGNEIPKTPTIAFRIDGLSPTEICEYLSNEGIFAGNGHFYAKTIGDVLDLNESGGWVRIGIAPYNTMDEVEHFLSVIEKLIHQ